ncbi:glycosyltransferase [uncultured Cetobacterium sp.]|uniref:glycosyltransferase n=1 Tax=uncultured Cetobacterium sp. TaxID=527638 RepID=UPI0025F9A724|nr:glycosyltransferase [uncultured Cetobacterium sp.]
MKKKIVFSIDTLLVGGIEKVLIELLKNISKERYEVTLLIGYKMDELEKLKNEIPKEVEIKYILEENIYTDGKKRKAMGTLDKLGKIFFEATSFIRKIAFKKRLLEYVKGADTVIDFDMTLASYAKDVDKNIVTFCHFSPKNYNRGIKRRQERHGKKLAMYDKVVVISEDMKKEAEEMYPFLSNKLVTIYNSFNIDELLRKSNESIDENDKKLMAKKYILSIGRLEETQKDFTTLIKAYKNASKKIEEKLYIIGDGRHRENLEKLIEELDLKDRVVLLGFRKNPYPWIKNASFFVHSSKFEGLPTVLIEASILGKAIISTDCPTGPREILLDGETGILTKIGDSEDLGKAIEKMSQSEELKAKYSILAKEKSKRFSSEEVMKKVEMVI